MSGDNKSASELAPLPAWRFFVQINGMTFPFRSCSGLKIEQTVVDLEEGGFNTTTRKLVGKVKYPNIVLKSGLCSGNSELHKLKLRYMNDAPPKSATPENTRWKTPDRFEGTITQVGPEGKEVKWYFSGAWIVKWEGPDLDASKNEISIESIEIAHNGLVMMGGSGPDYKDEKPKDQPPPEKKTTTVNFASGSSDTKGAIASDPEKRYRVEGHTDNVGAHSMNMQLSQQRADAVRNQLISGGAKPENVTAVGFGPDKPIADNSTSAGRAQNRRVEVIEE